MTLNQAAHSCPLLDIVPLAIGTTGQREMIIEDRILLTQIVVSPHVADKGHWPHYDWLDGDGQGGSIQGEVRSRGPIRSDISSRISLAKIRGQMSRNLTNLKEGFGAG